MNVLEYIKSFKRRILYRKVLLNDYQSYKKYYSTSNWSANNGNQAARDILVFCHVVEKGLSHKNIKPLFGYDRVSQISKSLEKYIKLGGKDKFIIDLALSTLKHYNEINKKLGVSDDKLIKIPIVNNFDNHSIDIGIDRIHKTDYFLNSNLDFDSYSKSRHSVRLYDCKSDPIELNDIIRAVEMAQSCPSACNRQAVRIKIITNHDLICKLCEIQGGSNGFYENAGALIIITSDISLYEPSERRMPMLDCGLFTMNLLYSLYSMQLGSCVLNGSFSLEREKRFNELITIPENEMYAALVLISNIPQNETVLVAHSKKRSVDDIITVIE